MSDCPTIFGIPAEVHWRCGLLGCDLCEFGPSCIHCGSWLYDYGYVPYELSLFRAFYALEWRIRSLVKAFFTVRRCYGPCNCVLPRSNKTGHCGKDTCDDLPF